MDRSIDNKRSYQKIGVEIRSQLIYKVLVLKQSVFKATTALKINYPAGKIII